MLDEKQIKIIEKLDKEQQNKLIKILYYKTFIKWLKENKGEKNDNRRNKNKGKK